MENEIELKEDFEENKILDEIENVQNNDNKIINDNNKKETTKGINIRIIRDEKSKLKFERDNEIESKKDLVNVLENLASNLKGDSIEKKTFNEIYEKYIDNDTLNKSQIKNTSGECLLKIMFYIIAPLFGIIFLTGIFQIKSLLNALWDLIKESVVYKYDCTINSNCNITLTNNETSAFQFYDYYFSYSMKETVDFNLMMITGFLGNIILILVLSFGY